MTNPSNNRAEIVSFDSEALILVDADDQPVGELNKADCHRIGGELHRAFSLFIFNEQKELLIQQRAQGKALWAGYWSNSCCSHPRVGETTEVAVARRSQEELGFSTEMDFVYKFEYTAHFEDRGTEHELCSVFIGNYHGESDINYEEISSCRWVSPDEVSAMLDDDSVLTTPWFAMEWEQLRLRGLV